jgi:hypothetical protein
MEDGMQTARARCASLVFAAALLIGPWKVLARSWLPRGDDLCALPDWTACPDAGATLMVDGRAMAILASSKD